MDTNILQLRKNLDTFTMEELKKEIIRVKKNFAVTYLKRAQIIQLIIHRHWLFPHLKNKTGTKRRPRARPIQIPNTSINLSQFTTKPPIPPKPKYLMKPKLPPRPKPPPKPKHLMKPKPQPKLPPKPKSAPVKPPGELDKYLEQILRKEPQKTLIIIIIHPKSSKTGSNQIPKANFQNPNPRSNPIVE